MLECIVMSIYYHCKRYRMKKNQRKTTFSPNNGDSPQSTSVHYTGGRLSYLNEQQPGTYNNNYTDSNGVHRNGDIPSSVAMKS